MEFAALLDAVSKSLPDNAAADDLRVLLGRIPKESYADFLIFYNRDFAPGNSKALADLAECVMRFNDILVDEKNLQEVIADLETKLADITPALLSHGFLSSNPPTMSWALIQNHYRLVADNTMLLFDFTKTEFGIIQKVKLDRAVRLVYQDAGEFVPYVKTVLSEEK